MDQYVYHVTVTGCSTTVQSADAILYREHCSGDPDSAERTRTICSTDDAAFEVVATGTNLNYLWQVNIMGSGFVPVVDGANINGQGTAILNITNAPGSFNNYIFRVIVSGTCGAPLYSNFVILRVNVPPSVTINPAPKAICADGGPVYFVANGSGLIDSLRWQVSTDNGVSWSDIYDNSIYSGTTTQQLSLIGIPLAYNNYQYRLALKAVLCATTYTNPATLTVNSILLSISARLIQLMHAWHSTGY